ncbi:MAG: hypothetical protein ACREUV_04945 [Burkholderiales bacterium]
MMRRYRLAMNYTQKARKVLSKEPDRPHMLFPMVERLGGRVERVQWASGKLVCTLDMPDCESFGALVTTLIASGVMKDIKITPQISLKNWAGAAQSASFVYYPLTWQ